MSRFLKADIPLLSAALAFDSLLSLIPLLGLGFFYLSIIGVTEQWQLHLRSFVLSQLNVLSSESFAKAFDDLVTRSRGMSWGWVGFVVLIYSVTGLLSRAGGGLDLVLEQRPFSVSDPLKPGFLWIRRALVTLLLPVAIAVSLGISQWIRHDSWFRIALDLPALAPLVGYLISFSLTLFVLWNFYLWMPRTRVPGKEAFRAALVASVLFEIARLVFQLYAARALQVHRLYGVFAIVPLSILWVQVIWMIFLGAALLIRTK